MSSNSQQIHVVTTTNNLENTQTAGRDTERRNPASPQPLCPGPAGCLKQEQPQQVLVPQLRMNLQRAAAPPVLDQSSLNSEMPSLAYLSHISALSSDSSNSPSCMCSKDGPCCLPVPLPGIETFGFQGHQIKLLDLKKVHDMD